MIMGVWGYLKEQQAKAIAGEAEAKELGLSSWEYAQLQVERRKYNAPNMTSPSKVTTITQSNSANFGTVFNLSGTQITYRWYGRLDTRSVKGVRAHIVESGSIFRKNRMIVEGPDFYWETEFSPSLAPNAQRFLRAVNTAARD